MDVAVERRIRHLNLRDIKHKGGKVETARSQALDPRRGYALGNLLLDGRLTSDQHEAGEQFAQDMSRFYGLTGVQFPSARAQNIFAVRGDSGEPEGRQEAAAKARSKAMKLRDILLKVGDIDTGRRVYRAVCGATVEDTEQARTWPEPMLTLLRRGLNKLAEHYVIER